MPRTVEDAYAEVEKENDELRAENERLRAALKRIAAFKCEFEYDDANTCADIALRALEQNGNDHG